MAQEVRNIDQRTPPTTQHRDRIPSRPVFVPPSDIYETRDSIVVLAEMPGVGPDGVDITLERRGFADRGRSGGDEDTGYPSVSSRSPKTLTATAPKRLSKTACCISFSPKRKPRGRERSSSRRRERHA